jgi:hypothetical protein
MTKQNIKIVKVPLSNSQKSINRPQVFPRMPRLYLELLENKSKIKQDLINKEYSPKKMLSPSPQINNNFDSKLDKFLNDPQENDEKSIEENNDDYLQKKNSLDNEQNDNDSDSDDDNKQKEHNKKDRDSDSDSEDDYKNRNDDRYKKISKKSKYDKDDDTDSEKPEKTKKSRKTNYDSDESDASSVNNLGSRLNELLDDNDNNTVVTDDKYSRKYSKHRSYDNDKISVSKYTKTKEQKRELPPSLAELEAKGGYVRKNVLRDINTVPYNEQEEEDLKREVMFKIDLLKKSYPNATIPEFSIYTDYKTMKQAYDDTVRRLSLDSTVENYKSYLIYGFTACEFLLGSVFNFDIQGFTQQQILNMNSYEKLLIELGEKSYVPTGSKWPVELRLLFMIIMNAAFFIISKMIMKKTGANLMGMINSMNVTSNNIMHNANEKKKKMKGPSIDVDNIPDN